MRTYTALDLLRFKAFADNYSDKKGIALIKAYNLAHPQLISEEKFKNLSLAMERLTLLEELQKSMGSEYPTPLNIVVQWNSRGKRHQYSHFGVVKKKAYFYIYNREDSEQLVWNLNLPLEDQSDDLIKWLHSLI